MSNVLDGMKLDVDTNINKVLKQFRHFDLDQRDEALAKGLINIGYIGRFQAMSDMDRNIHRPTNYTKKSLLVQTGNGYEPLSKSMWKKLRGNDYNVFLRFRDRSDTGRGNKTPPAEYLHTIIEGGNRKLKAGERQLRQTVLKSGNYAIPGKSFLDADGNIQRGTMQEILRDTRTQASAGYDSLGTKTRLQRRTTRAQVRKNYGVKEFVYMTPKGGAKREGVYERYRSLDGDSTLRPALLFTNDAPSYKKNTYPFYKLMSKWVDRRAEKILLKSFLRLDK